MIVTRDAKTGFWTNVGVGHRLANTHPAEVCEGRLCDVHDRRGPEPWATWPLNWREDRGMMEVIDPISGIGHPSRAQADYWMTVLPYKEYQAQMIHGCDGGCRGMYRG